MSQTIRIFIEEVPPSANRIWLRNRRTGQIYLSPQYRRFKALTGLKCAGQRMPESWKYCAVRITVHPRSRRGDVDNRIKAVLDALTFAGFWEDDKVVAEVTARFGRPDKDGCTLIEITERSEKYEN